MEQTFGFPPADELYFNLRKFDYVKFGENIILALATICAIVVGVLSYAFTALQLWWCDNGDGVVNSIKTNTNRVVDYFFYVYTDR